MNIGKKTHSSKEIITLIMTNIPLLLLDINRCGIVILTISLLSFSASRQNTINPTISAVAEAQGHGAIRDRDRTAELLTLDSASSGYY